LRIVVGGLIGFYTSVGQKRIDDDFNSGQFSVNFVFVNKVDVLKLLNLLLICSLVILHIGRQPRLQGCRGVGALAELLVILQDGEQGRCPVLLALKTGPTQLVPVLNDQIMWIAPHENEGNHNW
jgi:hypothetical protein